MMTPQPKNSRQEVIDLTERLFQLLFTQKLLRVFLNVLTVYCAVWLTGWIINTSFLASIETWIWHLVSICLVIFYVAASVRIKSKKGFLWQLDHELNLDERLSTAWQGASSGVDTPISKVLYFETSKILRQEIRRTKISGWHIKKEAISLTLIVFLGIGYYFLRPTDPLALNPYPDEPILSQLPQLPDPGACGVASENAQGSPKNEPGNTSTQFRLDNPNLLFEAIRDLGANLAKTAETHEAGKALQFGDLQTAAQEIETLANGYSNLSNAAQENLIQALTKAAEQTRAAGEDPLAEDLKSAAQNAALTLDNKLENKDKTAEALDKLAQDLRSLEELVMQPNPEPEPKDPTTTGDQEGDQPGGRGASPLVPSMNTEIGAPEEFTRFDFPAQDTLEFPSSSEVSSGSASIDNENAEDLTAISTGDPIVTSPGTSINPNTTPFSYYSFSWKWRDVIREFFSSSK